jgi:hypothetical protein
MFNCSPNSGRPFGAGAACFICKPKREFQLHISVLLEMQKPPGAGWFSFEGDPTFYLKPAQTSAARPRGRLTNVNAVSGNRNEDAVYVLDEADRQAEGNQR